MVVVKPETVVRWHLLGLRLYWRWKSRFPGRSPHGPYRVAQPVLIWLIAQTEPVEKTRENQLANEEDCTRENDLDAGQRERMAPRQQR
jgi:hypothetical protein